MLATVLVPITRSRLAEIDQRQARGAAEQRFGRNADACRDDAAQIFGVVRKSRRT